MYAARRGLAHARGEHASEKRRVGGEAHSVRVKFQRPTVPSRAAFATLGRTETRRRRRAGRARRLLRLGRARRRRGDDEIGTFGRGGNRRSARGHAVAEREARRARERRATKKRIDSRAGSPSPRRRRGNTRAGTRENRRRFVGAGAPSESPGNPSAPSAAARRRPRRRSSPGASSARAPRYPALGAGGRDRFSQSPLFADETSPPPPPGDDGGEATSRRGGGVRAGRVDGRGGAAPGLRRAGDDPHGECSVSAIDDVIDGSCFVGGGVASPPRGGCRVPGGVASPPPHGLDSDPAFSGGSRPSRARRLGRDRGERPTRRRPPRAFPRAVRALCRVGVGEGHARRIGRRSPRRRGMGFFAYYVASANDSRASRREGPRALGEAVPGGEADALDLGVVEGFGVSPVVHAMRVRAAHDDGDASVGGPAHAVLGERVGGILREPLALDEVRDDAVALDAQAAVAVGTDDDEAGVLVRRRGAVEASGPVVESTRARPVGRPRRMPVTSDGPLASKDTDPPRRARSPRRKATRTRRGDHDAHLTGHAGRARGGKHRRHRPRRRLWRARTGCKSDSAARVAKRRLRNRRPSSSSLFSTLVLRMRSRSACFVVAGSEDGCRGSPTPRRCAQSPMKMSGLLFTRGCDETRRARPGKSGRRRRRSEERTEPRFFLPRRPPRPRPLRPPHPPARPSTGVIGGVSTGAFTGSSTSTGFISRRAPFPARGQPLGDGARSPARRVPRSPARSAAGKCDSGPPSPPRRARLWRARRSRPRRCRTKSSHRPIPPREAAPRTSRRRFPRTRPRDAGEVRGERCASVEGELAARRRGFREDGRTSEASRSAKSADANHRNASKSNPPSAAGSRPSCTSVSPRASSPPVPRRRPRGGGGATRERDCASTRPTPDSSCASPRRHARRSPPERPGGGAGGAGVAGVAGAPRGGVDAIAPSASTAGPRWRRGSAHARPRKSASTA